MNIVIEHNPENKKMLSDLDGGTLVRIFCDVPGATKDKMVNPVVWILLMDSVGLKVPHGNFALASANDGSVMFVKDREVMVLDATLTIREP